MIGKSRAGCEQYDIPIKMLQSRRMVLGEDTIKEGEDKNRRLRM